MGIDVQICSDCGWQQTGDQINPNRKKCPNCGAGHFDREEIQWSGGHGAGGKEW